MNLIISLLLVAVAAAVLFTLKNPFYPKALIRGQTLRLELAVTTMEKEKGLGYRDNLPENQGMLFIYDHYEKFGFWMKGMRFPLDIIWIKDDQVADISENVPLLTRGSITTVQPDTEVNRVLEVNAGTVKRLGIKIGDKFVFTK